MKKYVLVTNTTDKDQSVIDIKRNEAVTISPGAGYIVDDFNEKHLSMYSAYARRGLKVEKVDDSFLNNVVTLKELPDGTKKLEECIIDNPTSLEEVVEHTFDPIEETKPEETAEVNATEDKPKRRSKKSNKSVSEISEEVSATAESGE